MSDCCHRLNMIVTACLLFLLLLSTNYAFGFRTASFYRYHHSTSKTIHQTSSKTTTPTFLDSLHHLNILTFSRILRKEDSILTTSFSTSLYSSSLSSSTENKKDDEEEIFDVIVIGSGIGGLSCAALTSSCYKYSTLCLEAHSTVGGVAHSFTRFSSAGKFIFDSGPSLLSGMSGESGTSTNPLRQVLDAIGTADTIQWKTYNGWMIHDISDNKSFKVTTGDTNDFENAIEYKTNSIQTKNEFIQFRNECLKPGGISDVSAYIPPFVIRNGSILSSIRPLLVINNYFWKILFQIGPMYGNALTGPFTNIMKQNNINDKFLIYWFDYISFALSGLDASQTQAAAVVYMMKDLHKPNAILDYPMGGLESLIQALVYGVEKNKKSEVRINSRVEKLLLTTGNDGQQQPICQGVIMTDGKIIRARKGVVCNAPLWNMARIVKDSIIEDGKSYIHNTNVNSATTITTTTTTTINNDHNNNSVMMDTYNKIQKQANEMNMTRSFMHLHLGIPSNGLPEDLECHHSVFNMNYNITDEQNMVIISIPSIFDPNLAPPGYHVIHAYTAACDNFEQFESFLPDNEEIGKVGYNPNSMKASSYNQNDEYQTLKNQKVEVLWKAIECIIPDVRKRAEMDGSVVLIGTPLTHRRYNLRYKGTYGPAPKNYNEVWELPGSITPITNLYACGDTTFPGTFCF